MKILELTLAHIGVYLATVIAVTGIIGAVCTGAHVSPEDLLASSWIAGTTTYIMCLSVAGISKACE